MTYTIQGSTTISTTATFFDTGTVQTATDTKGNQTTYAYGNCGNSFVTSITMPLSLSRSQSWNCNGSAAMASATDENGRVTSYSYDSMNRLTQTNFPDGGWKLTTYTGAIQQDSYTGITDTTPSSGCTGCRHDQTNLDNQGRQLNSILVSDPEGQTTVATVYDSVGRVQKTSNPYRTTGDPTYGFDTRAYDSLHRVTSVTHQDNKVAYTYYGPNVGTHGGASTQLCASGTYGLGYPALQVDEAAKKRQVWSDALRRAIEADEPDSSGNLTVATCYKYDVLNNLTEVDQGSETRTYAFDGLSRKTSETTPEAGTRNFYFTTSGGALCSGDPKSPCRETGARAITITYAYDALNRLTGKTYSDSTPAASYFYDQTSYNGLTITNGKARRTGMSDGSGQTPGATTRRDAFSLKNAPSVA